MIEVVFISDLHLHPDDLAIQERFNQFIAWAKTSVKNVYILGDFFHVWAGDDSINDWSLGIAKQLHSLVAQGINLFYIHGNRDFLLGKDFAKRAGWHILTEPTCIQLGTSKVLLVHGDRYCTQDISHQRFRKMTRNRLFITLFLHLPLGFRNKLVSKVRKISQSNTNKTMEQMDVVPDAVIKHMVQLDVSMLIHGHTHKAGITHYMNNGQKLDRYVLSDWDDRPQLLCYDNTNGIYFTHIGFCGD